VQRELPIPSCLWRGEQGDKQASIYIEKELLNAERGIACDFYLKQPFNLIAEVKVAVLKTAQQVFNAFLKDIEKCKNWLKPEISPIIEKKFGISRFNYALALLIDLTGDEGFSAQWNSIVDEAALSRQGVIARLVSPVRQP
jgi:hypothetical protein